MFLLFFSLMRNGVIPALFPSQEQEIEALDATVLQGIITHWSPICVLTCVVQTLLIRKGLLTKDKTLLKPPTLEDIKELLSGPWNDWKQKTKNEFTIMVRIYKYSSDFQSG